MKKEESDVDVDDFDYVKPAATTKRTAAAAAKKKPESDDDAEEEKSRPDGLDEQEQGGKKQLLPFTGALGEGSRDCGGRHQIKANQSKST